MIQIALARAESYQGRPQQTPITLHAGRSEGPKAAPDMIRNTSSNWGALARWFHWGLGITIIAMIAYGWWMNHFPARADRFFYRSIHADIGYAVLLLMVFRRHHPCRAMLGWAHSGARTPNYSNWFGLFHVPQITSPDKAAAAAYEDRHIFFAYLLLALIVIHLAAALWHHFVRRDRVAVRMINGTLG